TDAGSALPCPRGRASSDRCPERRAWPQSTHPNRNAEGTASRRSRAFPPTQRFGGPPPSRSPRCRDDDSSVLQFDDDLDVVLPPLKRLLEVPQRDPASDQSVKPALIGRGERFSRRAIVATIRVHRADNAVVLQNHFTVDGCSIDRQVVCPAGHSRQAD